MSSKKKMTVGQIIGSTFANFGRVILALIMVGIITGCIVASVLTVYILRYINAEEQISLDSLSMKYTTILYAKDASTGETYELQRLQAMENRIWVPYNKIPKHMVAALVAIEDKRFYEHQGVDWKRTFGAFVNMFVPIYSSQHGGSTITQQLIKNVTGDDAVRVDRKVQEIFRAINLEKNYSKEQILEAYLNTVYYANNSYGVQAAANTYFGKDVSDLTVAEAASIIGITQFPGKWDPFVNPDKNKERQEEILEKMFEQGMITQEEHDEAVAEELHFQKETAYERINPVYSYFVDHVIEEVIDDLVQQKGYTYEIAQQMITSGGLRIFTTVDERVQNIVTDYYSDVENFPKTVTNKEYPQSAVAIVDPNGAIVALAGEIGPKTGMRQFSRATMAKRQPGSSIKPISCYLQGIEHDIITWSTMIVDSPIMINDAGTTREWPKNFQGSYLNIPITVDQAIQQSRNTIPAKLIQMITPRRSFDFLTGKLGMYSLVEREVIDGRVLSDVTPSAMALGGLTYGVTPLEMAGAYQIFSNGGYFTPPYAYTEVRDAEDNIILQKDINPRRVISAETATIMNKLLMRVTTGPMGTGTRAPWGPMPVAGKTGTSSEDYDQWFVGATPYYSAAVWMGFDEPTRIGYTQYPPPLVYNTLMSRVHEGLEVKPFDVWGDVVEKTYCTKSGELAIAGCPTATGWYKKSYLPPECTLHSGTTESVELDDAEDGESSGSSRSSNSSSSAGDRLLPPGQKRSPSGLIIIDNND